MIANNVGSYWREPQTALWIPLFPLINGFLLFVYWMQRIFSHLEWRWGLTIFQAPVLLCCALEVFRPGLILGILPSLQRRIRLATKTEVKSNRTDNRKTVILVILLLLLLVLGWRRYQEGMLTPESLQAVGRVAFKILAPMIVLFLFLRSRKIFTRIMRDREQSGYPASDPSSQ